MALNPLSRDHIKINSTSDTMALIIFVNIASMCELTTKAQKLDKHVCFILCVMYIMLMASRKILYDTYTL